MAGGHFSAEELEKGRLLFSGGADFVAACGSTKTLIPEGPLEIAFAGRSNVGKSSLINALTGRKALARTSNTPGRTQELIFFDIGGRFRLVDMPGYGFAKTSKSKVEAWTDLIFDYLRGRSTLARLFLLIDARRGVKDSDSDAMNALDKAAVPYQIVLTKADAVKRNELSGLVAQTRSLLAKRPAAHPEILVTSAETGAGVADMRAVIVRLLKERGV